MPRERKKGLVRYVEDYLADPAGFEALYGNDANAAMDAYGLTPPQKKAMLDGDLAAVHAQLGAEIGEIDMPTVWHFAGSV